MKITKSSTRKVETHTGKLPVSFGMPSGTSQGGGVIRKLTKRERVLQSKLQNL